MLVVSTHAGDSVWRAAGAIALGLPHNTMGEACCSAVARRRARSLTLTTRATGTSNQNG
jgi:hypothetical protein